MSERSTIGILPNSLAGDFILMALAGIRAVVHERGYELLVISSPPTSVAANSLAYGQVAGWIALVDSDGLEQLLEPGRPVVLAGGRRASRKIPCVVPDNQGGARLAVEHLIDHGHTRIGFIGHMGNPSMHERFTIYQAVLRQRGLPLDERLVLDVGGYSTALAHNQTAEWLAERPDCTAVFVSSDELALGVMAALADAGLRVPEDVAVVGFDDIVAAQHTTPPLSTVRQQPELLGRRAAQMLFDLLDGTPAPVEPVAIPTGLVQRRSCGCEDVQAGLLALGGQAGADGWQAALAVRLARIISYPLPLDPELPPAQAWPEMAIPIAGLEAALAGEPLPARADLEAACRAAVRANKNLEVLFALTSAIEQAGAQAAGELQAPPATSAQIARLVEQLRLAMTGARLASEQGQMSILERALQANYHLSLGMAEGMRGARYLEWLRETSARIGCLALWDEQHGQRLLRIAEVYGEPDPELRVGRAVVPELFPPPGVPGPPGQYVAVLPLVTTQRDWGYLTIWMHEKSTWSLANMHMWVGVLGTALDRAELEGQLHAERETLRDSLERERILADTVRELGCPIIPLRAGMLLVPLIGVIDSRRAEQIVETILEGIGRYRAVHMLIDITGVPIVDTHVAGLLIQTTRAAQLLGARAALVGVRPEIAQSIVALGVDLSPFTTYPTLAAGLSAKF